MKYKEYGQPKAPLEYGVFTLFSCTTLEYIFFLTRQPIYDTNPNFSSPQIPEFLLSGAYVSPFNIQRVEKNIIAIDELFLGITTLKYLEKENLFVCSNSKNNKICSWTASSSIKDFVNLFVLKDSPQKANEEKRLLVEVTGRGILLRSNHRTYQIKPDNNRIFVTTILPDGETQYAGWFKTIKDD